MTGYLGLIELLFFVAVVFGFGFWQHDPVGDDRFPSRRPHAGHAPLGDDHFGDGCVVAKDRASPCGEPRERARQPVHVE